MFKHFCNLMLPVVCFFSAFILKPRFLFSCLSLLDSGWLDRAESPPYRRSIEGTAEPLIRKHGYVLKINFKSGNIRP